MGITVKASDLKLITENLQENLAEKTPKEKTKQKKQSKLTLTNFLNDFNDGLLKAVQEQNPPIYQGQNQAQRNAILQSLKRQPFTAQAKVIHAVTQLLLDADERAAIINGEMGTGKSLMGAATATLLHYAGLKRTLVLCPPHLVYKWRREILETVPNAQVIILNGADTLAKLMQLKEQAKKNTTRVSVPTFYIMGRVRLRLGPAWQATFIKRRQIIPEQNKNNIRSNSAWFEYAACPSCGAFIHDKTGDYQTLYQIRRDLQIKCPNCKMPLWTLTRRKENKTLAQALCQLPTVGAKMAKKLMQEFGEETITNCLSDNVYQLVNLMDKEGQLIFSDIKAERLERALGKLEFTFNQGEFQASEFIKRYLPKNFFSLLIIDEGHEYKGASSAQGQALGVVASQVKKILLLTGTLMGGYADDLFYLLHRIMPTKMLADGYRYNKAGSLGSAAQQFMETHGILKEIFTIKDEGNFRTARGKRESMRTAKAPGFGPQGLARYLLPYTAFLKLTELDNQVLPPYQEHFVNVAMLPEQTERYEILSAKLMQELKESLARGDRTLLGVILNCLLAWPDCCFREEDVVHPRTRKTLAFVPPVLDDEPSPKEQTMLEICQEAKAQNRRTLVYTIYTGTRDTTARLANLAAQAGLKAAVLKASVKPDLREDWILEQVEKDIDVLICNPELVKTGLDLIDFPTIVFLQTGYNTYSFMQATRRSWRIGQNQPVHVYFLGYRATAQIACLSLMAKKIAVSQSTAGTMPETGLDILNHDGDSVEVALARQLVSSNKK